MDISIRKKARTYYRQGIEYPQGSRKSQDLFELSIKTDPSFSYAYFEKSVPYNKRGDYEIGFNLLNIAVSLNPRMHLGYRGWLRLVKLKDFNGCIKDLKELKKISPSTKKAWGQNINYVIGLAYKELREFDEALKYFKIYLNEIDIVQVNPYVYLYRCIICIETLDYKSAKQNIVKMIDCNNASAEAYYYKAILHRLQNELQRSKVSFRFSKYLFNKGYFNKNVYNEVINELYLSDIIEVASF